MLAGKTLIDLNYEKQKAEALLRAQCQTLVLHGLSQEQVDDILKARKLLQKLSVYAPEDEARTKSVPFRFATLTGAGTQG